MNPIPSPRPSPSEVLRWARITHAGALGSAGGCLALCVAAATVAVLDGGRWWVVPVALVGLGSYGLAMSGMVRMAAEAAALAGVDRPEAWARVRRRWGGALFAHICSWPFVGVAVGLTLGGRWLLPALVLVAPIALSAVLATFAEQGEHGVEWSFWRGRRQ